jgi:Cu(I)/Ag(I) efflux system membrane protein CusA/SilA
MLKNHYNYTLQQPLLPFLLFGLLIAWGLSVAPFDWNYPYKSNPVPIDAIPDLGENQQIVYTDWNGQSPEDIEDQITYPLSNYFLTLAGVKDVRGLSITGRSTLYIIFEEDVDFYWSRSRIIERINSLPQGTLPEGVQPSLGPDATGLGQIFWYYLEGVDKEGTEVGGWNLEEKRSLQDFYIKTALSSVSGVSEVASIGGFVKEFQVDIDPLVLQQYGLTIQQVFRRLEQAQAEGGLKTLEFNRSEYLIRGVAPIEQLEDLARIPLASVNQTPLYLGDIALLQYGPTDRRGALDVNGSEAVGGVIVAQYGANPKEVIDNIHKKINELSSSLPVKTLDDGRNVQLKIIPFYDRSEVINETIGTLEHALWLQILITIAIVLLILRRLRMALLISIMLPISVLLTFVAMKLATIDANVVALSGIAIAIGTVVDMGVILTDTILQKLDQQGVVPQPNNRKNFLKARLKLIIDATQEVAGAIVTAITTTVISFLPVFTMIEAEGKLFKPLAFTKTFVLISSILVALSLLPILSYMLFGRVEWVIRSLKTQLTTLQNYLSPGAFHSRVSQLKKLAMYALILWVVYLLAAAWQPLGVQHIALLQFLFVGLLLLILVFSVQHIIKRYPRWLAWALIYKKRFLSIPIIIILMGLYVWLGFGRFFSPLSTTLERLRIPVSSTLWWQHMEQEYPGLPTEFMPSLDEGAFLYMPTTIPSAGVELSLELMQFLDKAISTIPEIEQVVGKMGRVESALDPAPLTMFEHIIRYKTEYIENEKGEILRFKTSDEGTFLRDSDGQLIPKANGKAFRQWRNHIQTSDDIWSEIIRVSSHPALTSAPKLQPIETRILMLQTGLRAPLGIRLQGEDIQDLQQSGQILEEALKKLDFIRPETVFAERNASKPYLEILWDREELARYNMSVSQAQEWAMMSIAGLIAGEVQLGRERFNIRLRLAKEYRNDPQSLANLLVDTPQGARVPLSTLASINYRLGPQAIKSEQSFKVSYVSFDVPNKVSYTEAVDKLATYIADARQSGDLIIPEGIQLTYTGSFENQVRAEQRLRIILPLTLLLILIILYLQFRSLVISAMIFIGVFVAWSGGFLLLSVFVWDGFATLTGGALSLLELFKLEPISLSIAVWVGFLALFGIATDGGVVMATILQQRLELRPNSNLGLTSPIDQKTSYQGKVAIIREKIVAAGTERIRPTLITTATTIVALIPLFTSQGKGSEIMIPMAIPTLGGMFVQLITLIIVPVLFAWVEEARIKKLMQTKNPQKRWTKLFRFLPMLCILGLSTQLGFAQQSIERMEMVQPEKKNSEYWLATYKEQALANYPSFQSQLTLLESYNSEANSIGLADPSVAIGVFVKPVETALGAQKARYTINQALPLPGEFHIQRSKIYSRKEQARLELALSALDHFEQMELLWSELYIKSQGILLLNEQKRILQEMIELLNTLNQEGLASQQALIEAQIRLESIEFRIMEFDVDLRQSRSSFNRLRNVDPQDAIYIPSRLEGAGTLLSKEEGEITPITVDEGYPSLSMAREKLEFLAYETEWATYQRLPKISLGIDYIVVDPRNSINPISGNGNDAVIARLSMSVPLWQTQKNSVVLATEQKRKSAEISYKYVLLDMQDRLEKLSSEHLIHTENIKRLGIQIRLMDELLELTQRELETENGDLKSFFDTLDRKIALQISVLDEEKQLFLLEKQKKRLTDPEIAPLLNNLEQSNK